MRIIFSFVVVLCLCHASAAESPAEVEASREAAKRHNASVESAEERLERAIERAKADHNKAVISAKERMIEDLRRAFRVAMRSDAPENSVKIANQIKRLESQIEALREPEVEEQPEVKLKGLDPRLVGIFVHRHHNKRHGAIYRVYRISDEGVVTVLSHQNEGDAASETDVGKKYQGVIKDGYLYVRFTGYRVRNAPKGRIQAWKVLDNGQMEMLATKIDEYDQRGFVAQDRLQLHYDTLHYASLDALKEYEAKREGKTDVADVPDVDRSDANPEPVEPEPEPDNEKPEEDDGPTDFFGVPIE